MKRYLSLLIAALLFLFLAACGAKDAWQEKYDLGMHYLNDGNYEDAVIAFTAAIEIDPKRPEAYAGLANTYMAQGEFEKAATVWSNIAQEIMDSDNGFTMLKKKSEAIRTALENGENGVWIMSCSFDKAHFTAEKETMFQVAVLYNNASGAEGSLYLSARDGDSSETKGCGDGVTAKTGVGACQLTGSAVPTHGGRYFVLRADLFTGSVDNSDWYSDSIYITPEGEVSENYAPLNAYGSTEFIYRSHYKDFSSLDAAAQSRVISIAEAAIAGDQEKLLALVDTNDGLNSSFYTIWNGYKIEITDHAEWELDNDGDEWKSFAVEIRPENGTGYYYDAYKSRMVDTAGRDGWHDYYNVIDVTSCPCIDWQWNGSASQSENRESLYRSANGATRYTIESGEVTGTMADGLWEGPAVRTVREISDWSPAGWDDTDETKTETLNRQNGSKCEQGDGVIYRFVPYPEGVSYVGLSEQDILERRYW
jgi:tetratricopeptide (TPR) repeat protein